MKGFAFCFMFVVAATLMSATVLACESAFMSAANVVVDGKIVSTEVLHDARIPHLSAPLGAVCFTVYRTFRKVQVIHVYKGTPAQEIEIVGNERLCREFDVLPVECFGKPCVKQKNLYRPGQTVKLYLKCSDATHCEPVDFGDSVPQC